MKTWVFSTDTGWLLCHRLPSETPGVDFDYVTPFILKKGVGVTKDILISKGTKSELLKLGIMELWNGHCAFEPMKVEPKEVTI